MRNVKSFFISCLVVTVLFSFTHKTFAAEKDMLLIFDASGSMSDQFGGTPRIDALKNAVNDLLNTLDSTVLVGLRPFANLKKSDQTEACRVTSLAQNFTTERSIIKTQTSLLQAVGSYTPLAYTLTVSAGDFRVGNDNVLVLLTDGKDTCGGDPVKAAGDLFNSSKKIKVYVIGMGVDADTKAQLSLIANKGGGVYYDASNSVTLAASLKAIQTLEQPKVRVENITPMGGTVKTGGNDFGTAEYLSKDVDYRLKDSLAPGQFAYFKFPVDYYRYDFGDKSKNLKITFTIFGDRMGVSYNPTINSFEESNLHNYRMEFFDTKSFPTLTPIEVKDTNLTKKSFIISGEQCAGGKDEYYCYIKIGSKDFSISKYDLFKVEIAAGESLTPTTTSLVASNINNTTKLKQADVNTKYNPEKADGSSNTLVYILISVVSLLLIIIVIVLIILLKKKNIPPPTSI